MESEMALELRALGAGVLGWYIARLMNGRGYRRGLRGRSRRRQAGRIDPNGWAINGGVVEPNADWPKKRLEGAKTNATGNH